MCLASSRISEHLASLLGFWRMLNGPPNAETSTSSLLPQSCWIHHAQLIYLQSGEKMIRMQEVICPGVGAEGFTPVMIHPKKATFIDYGKCIWRIYVHYIHHPYFQVLECSSKSCSVSAAKSSGAGFP